VLAGDDVYTVLLDQLRDTTDASARLAHILALQAVAVAIELAATYVQ
jgi:hypothetical protein